MRNFGIVLMFLLLVGCANLTMPTAKPEETINITDGSSIKVIVPKDKKVQDNSYQNITFTPLTWGRQYNSQGKIVKQESLRIKSKNQTEFRVERRIDNGISGSGVIYDVAYRLEDDQYNNYITFQPIRYTKYQQGLILPFDVPTFNSQNLMQYIMRHPIRYTIEINSEYNTESIFANFKRLSKEERASGEADSVTGKIFKNRFSLPHGDERVYFSLETFPYRNGTKALVYLSIPARYTSENTVDFTSIIKEIEDKIISIVNS